MKRVEIEPSALSRLEQIYAYSVHRWGAPQALTYSDRLYDEIDAVADGRFTWRRIPASSDIDGYVRKCGSHLIYWRCGKDDVVRIVAVLHQRMHQSSRLRDMLDGEP